METMCADRLTLSYIMNPVPQAATQFEPIVIQGSPKCAPAAPLIPSSPMPRLEETASRPSSPEQCKTPTKSTSSSSSSSCSSSSSQQRPRRKYRPRKFKLVWFDFTADKNNRSGKYKMTSDPAGAAPPPRKVSAHPEFKSDDAKTRAAVDMPLFFSRWSRGLAGADLAHFASSLQSRADSLFDAPTPIERAIAVAIADCILSMEMDESSARVTRVCKQLNIVLRASVLDPVTASLAASVLAHLSRVGGNSVSDAMENEIKLALDWVAGDLRVPGLLVLKAIARSMPSLFYVHVPTFITLVPPAFADKNEAYNTTCVCLELCAGRQNLQKNRWYQSLYDSALEAVKVYDTVHGGLLTFDCLLTHAKEFIEPSGRFKEIFDIVLANRDHRDRFMARVMPTVFGKDALRQCVEFLVLSINRGTTERPAAFAAIGELAEFLGLAMQPHANMITQAVMAALSPRRVASMCPEALKCTSQLARVFKAVELVQGAGAIMSQVLTTLGLSPALTDALNCLCDAFPELLPASVMIPSPPLPPQPMQMTQGEADAIVNALRIISAFHWRTDDMLTFANNVVMPYLDNESLEIRREAVTAVATLLLTATMSNPEDTDGVSVPIPLPTRGHAAILVESILVKLLGMCCSDVDSSIRLGVLRSLDPRFDRHLSRPHHLNALFVALNDESFDVRDKALSVLGRLYHQNPAYISTTLRATLVEILAILEFSVSPKVQEQGAQMLSKIIRIGKTIVKCYVDAIMKSLLSLLNSPNPRLAMYALKCLGELAGSESPQLAAHVNDLMPPIIDTLRDRTPTGEHVGRREIALWALGEIARATSFVIQPYLKYPDLLDILLNAITAERARPIRMQLLKVVGILGAIDPYEHRKVFLVHTRQDRPEQTGVSVAAEVRMPYMPAAAPEYNALLAICSLLKILKDPNLATYHKPAMQNLAFGFQALGKKCIPHIKVIVPPFISIMHTCSADLRGTGFELLALITSVVDVHVREYVPDLTELLHSYWEDRFLVSALTLLEQLAASLAEDLQPHLKLLVPLLLRSLQNEAGAKHKNPAAICKALEALEVMGNTLEEHVHLLIAPIASISEQADTPVPVAKDCIRTIAKMSRVLNLSVHLGRIIHPLIRILERPSVSKELCDAVLEALIIFVKHSPYTYAPFVPAVHRVLERHMLYNEAYISMASAVDVMHRRGNAPFVPLSGMCGVSAADFNEPPTKVKPPQVTLGEAASVAPNTHYPLNTRFLQTAWETVSQRSTTDDWFEWLRQFMLAFLRESPAPPLRVCQPLAQEYPPLVRDLFGAAFLSCWDDLPQALQKQLVRSLELSLQSPSTPHEVVQTLLNLAEFMEREDKELPLENLGTLALKNRAFAKALRYKELQYQQSPQSPRLVEDLISINTQMQQSDAANGILLTAQQKHSVELQEAWYEKLGRWEDAKDVHERRLQSDPKNTQALLGRIRCLEALGQYRQVASAVNEVWQTAAPEVRKELAPLAAASAWSLKAWLAMEVYVDALPAESASSFFYRAAILVHKEKFAEAQQLIDSARSLLDPELTALVGESYDRAYVHFVRAQQLSDLEEVIEYKRMVSPEVRARARRNFCERLRGCKYEVDTWQRLLRVHELAFDPSDDPTMWIKFVGLCRKSERPLLAHHVLTSITGREIGAEAALFPVDMPRVALAYAKLLWSCADDLNGYKQAFELLTQLRASLPPSDRKMLARVNLKVGQWHRALMQMQDTFNEDVIPEILSSFAAANEGEEWYKALHAWALVNFEVVSLKEKQHQGADASSFLHYLTTALKAFIRSIDLCTSDTIQDALRLLTLAFKHGHIPEVEELVLGAIATLKIETWLDVIPQIIARIHSAVPATRRITHELLSAIGRHHPQALLYPLTVASKSQSHTRVAAAKLIMEKIRATAGALVDQAVLISHEFVHLAVVWHEMWFVGINEASRLCYEEHNMEGMMAVLNPLYSYLDKGAESPLEESFQQNFGQDLQVARRWIKQHQRTRDFTDLQHGWDIFYNVFGALEKLMKNMTTIEVKQAAPKLAPLKNLQLAVPGTYRPDQPPVLIKEVVATLPVIPSKQRPRRMTILGSNGLEYMFLLKAHEDLRQDERVMQLFSLVNSLLAHAGNVAAARQHLSIVCYSIVPLSPNSGLIGWVLHSDTFHELIKEYRESKKIVFDVEFRLQKQMAPPYDNLTLMQKVEVLRWVLDSTDGMDFRNTLWLRSPNSEAWLQRRSNYTRSLAVMSMVGYILGLGDRHPSNLMLDRDTGDVIHIDFGDCFETAMHRASFPERIPFRLTRMLVNAMEVSGVEGTFRATCERVMKVLRDNKDSLLAVLEAFVHDPLINWRLLPQQQQQQQASQNQQQQQQQQIGMQRGPSIRAWANNDDILLHIGETPGGSMFRSIGDVADDVAGRTLATSAGSSPAMPQLSAAEAAASDTLNERALSVMKRVTQKLNGRDFNAELILDVHAQVDRLIRQATDLENLAGCYRGWCPFW
eukprot:m51a1_g9284 putative phosphatidylinositol kinase tor2 (2481) ;mRNA; r:2709-12776